MEESIDAKLNKIKYTIESSLYFSWIKNNVWILVLCLLISTLLCGISYPGIIYSDSYGRVNITDGLKLAIHAFLTGNASSTQLQSWITITPSFFILLSKEITGSIILYTFVQCFLLFFASCCMAENITEKGHKVWNCFWILVCPVLWAYGVYYEASIGCVSAIIGILLIIWKWDYLRSSFDKAVSIILLVFSSFICFGYRANAFTILPVLILIIFLKEKKKAKSVLLSAGITFGLLLSWGIPKALHINTMSSYAGAFVWESISTIQEMNPTKKAEYSTYFDDIFGKGVTATALARNSYKSIGSSINSIWWGKPFRTNDVSNRKKSREVLRKYLSLIKNEPATYFKVKFRFITNTLGIGTPIKLAEYNYNRNNNMGKGDFVFNDSAQRLAFVNYFLAFMAYMEIFRMPWLLFLIALALIILWRLKFYEGKETINLYEASYGIALFYYGCFILNNQSFEFRYFFPSWLLLMMIIISLSADIGFKYKYLKKGVIGGFLILALMSLLGGHKLYTQYGNSLIAKVESKGHLLHSDNINQVYYLDGKLYFIANSNADTAYTYFLHYYDLDGKMINNDFKFDRQKIASSSKKIAARDIPKQAIDAVNFGQYYGSKRFWETSVNFDSFLRCPETITVSDFSDKNWTKGYSTKEKCLLLDDSSFNNYMLKGRYLLLQNGKKIKITNVLQANKHMKVYTADKINEINNRKIMVTDK